VLVRFDQYYPRHIKVLKLWIGKSADPQSVVLLKRTRSLRQYTDMVDTTKRIWLFGVLVATFIADGVREIVLHIAD
jgi:hypothetical protein